MKILIDNGHGENTKGKCSPDGRLREWSYTREIAKLIEQGLRSKGIDAERIVKENIDIPLKIRCDRVNTICRNQNDPVYLISIHCNAAGNGDKWMNASGWSAFVSNNASVTSIGLATHFAQTARKMNIPIRIPEPNQLFWQQDLAICRDTICPALLTENFFQDNKKDVDFLLSDEGKQTVAQIHINSLLNFR